MTSKKFVTNSTRSSSPMILFHDSMWMDQNLFPKNQVFLLNMNPTSLVLKVKKSLLLFQLTTRLFSPTRVGNSFHLPYVMFGPILFNVWPSFTFILMMLSSIPSLGKKIPHLVIIRRVMLTCALKISNKFYIEKITFETFKTSDVQFPRKNFYIWFLNLCPKGTSWNFPKKNTSFSTFVIVHNQTQGAVDKKYHVSF
ncbi:transmembrane protein, putative [Medicago truncatula]|uniref:Transmembrane protein, putative n=1 Tax=Medicago truncatula TaxID=3880 RepID=G7KV92_MEDTR|nr:transmembrane protein, putative [Medicago truncatula]